MQQQSPSSSVDRPGEVSTPHSQQLGLHEVLIQLYAVGFNGFEPEIPRLGSTVNRGPIVLGIEHSGVVARRGEHVQDFNVGDKVLALCWTGDDSGPAAFQSHVVVVNTALACHKPSNISFADAAAIPLAFDTAARVVRDALDLPPSWHDDYQEVPNASRRFMIFGGNSPEGSDAIQILRYLFPSSWIGATIYGDDKELLEQEAIQMVIAGATFAIDGADADSLPDLHEVGRRPVEVVLSFPHPEEKDEEVLRCLGQPRVFHANEAYGGMGASSNERRSMALLEELLKSGQYQVTFPAHVVGRGLDAMEAMLRDTQPGRGSRNEVVYL